MELTSLCPWCGKVCYRTKAATLCSARRPGHRRDSPDLRLRAHRCPTAAQNRGLPGKAPASPNSDRAPTNQLLEVRPHAASVLPARMTQIMALMALTALGLSGSPVHEPVHG
jgi:hypothetical protein